jgi:hypothetical protein
VDVIAQKRHHIIHHRLIAREDDVRASGIVGEALLLDRLAVTSAAAFLFEHFALMIQMRGDGETCQPAAQNSSGQSLKPFLRLFGSLRHIL